MKDDPEGVVDCGYLAVGEVADKLAEPLRLNGGDWGRRPARRFVRGDLDQSPPNVGDTYVTTRSPS